MDLIIIKFGELLLWISLRIINDLRSYIKHPKERLIRYPTTSKLVKKIQLHLVFSTHFSVFGYLMKHSSLCLIYYLQHLITEWIYYHFKDTGSQTDWIILTNNNNYNSAWYQKVVCVAKNRLIFLPGTLNKILKPNLHCITAMNYLINYLICIEK